MPNSGVPEWLTARIESWGAEGWMQDGRSLGEKEKEKKTVFHFWASRKGHAQELPVLWA